MSCVCFGVYNCVCVWVVGERNYAVVSCFVEVWLCLWVFAVVASQVGRVDLIGTVGCLFVYFELWLFLHSI